MKTVMITGSNIGLGKEAARQLASVDGVEKVILACRNKSKADAAKEDLEKITGKKKFYEVVVLDTSDLASVRRAVASVGDEDIDGLIMNAGGPVGMDLTSDGVSMSFAANVLGHVVLTEELIKAGKLSGGGSVVYVSTEVVRGLPSIGAERVTLRDHSVEEFKKVADGRFLEETNHNDPLVGIYVGAKYMGTLWNSYMARQHPDIRFVTVGPGVTSGTNVLSNDPRFIAKMFYTFMLMILSFFGAAHGVAAGAKRYIDVLTDTNTYKTGEFYASKQGGSGPMSAQSEASPSITEYKDTKIQDNCAQAIHDIINKKDFENRAKAKAQTNTAA